MKTFLIFTIYNQEIELKTDMSKEVFEEKAFDKRLLISIETREMFDQIEPKICWLILIQEKPRDENDTTIKMEAEYFIENKKNYR